MLFGPHETNLGGSDRGVSADHVAYYAERAAGGAGLVVVEPASVHRSDHPYAYAPAAFAPAPPGPAAAPGPTAPARPTMDLRAEMQFSGVPGDLPPAEPHLGDVPAGPGWAAVVEACRPYGTLVLAGLAHAGGQGSTAHSGHPLWGPSAVPDVVSREIPVELDAGQIEQIVLGFAAAARSAVDNAVDGVEISAGQHSLLRQFCSGLTNRRTDDYGRDRTLLLRRVLAAVRAEIGPDPLLAVRLCVDELAPWAGITPAEGEALARAVAGDVDLIVPVVGSGLSVAATRPDLRTPEAFLRDRCARVRRAVDGAALVVLAGSVASPWIAEEALACGGADLVEMTRAQIADPRLVELTRAGTPGRIRPCLLTHALAAGRDPRNPVVGDELEPRSGRERDEPTLPEPGAAPGVPPARGTRGPVPAPARAVLVVGGGPAGLEAARTLALHGRRVTLHERADRLGGMLHAAAVLPGRGRFTLPVAWWERELERLGVQVVLGSEPDGRAVAAAAADGTVIVLATGSRARTGAERERTGEVRVPLVPAAELARAVAAHDVGPGRHEPIGTGDTVRSSGRTRAGCAPPAGPQAVRAALAGWGVAQGAPVLVRDPLGDWTGPGLAELLAGAGYEVTLSTPDAVAGHQLGRCGDLAPANARLERAGVRRALFTELDGALDGVARLVDVHTAAVGTVPCAVVVDCAARLPELSVPHAPGWWSAGDRIAPRTVAEAVREGRRVAQMIAGAGHGGGGRPHPAARASGPAVEVNRPSGQHGPIAPAATGPARSPGATGPAVPVVTSTPAAPAPCPAPAARATSGGPSRLGEPLRLGRRVLRNRIVFTAHLTGFAEDGLPTPRHTAYYAARAAGGAALVITEEHAVHPDDRPYERLIRGHDPAVLPAYRALTEAVHGHGALVLAQLNHNGAQGSGTYSREPVVGPSPLPDPMFREVPAELDAAGITDVVAAFADVAARCVDGGFDGVELQCSHASLLRLFLSPATNRRTDAWGRDRAKIVLDVVAAVREAIGPDPVLGLRIGADERIPGGITPDDGAELARRLVRTGAVDHLNTSIGVATSTLHLIEPSMHTPPGYAGRLAARLRSAVRSTGSDVPVIGVGRFTTPAQAAGALDRAECDLVGVARGQIADPEFAARALAGRPVRRCVGCNQDCIGRVGLNLPLGCVVNPAAGREWLTLGAGVPTPAGTRRVLVAGAGPAGLSAAAALARRGHDVTLVERAARPGGRLALAARAPGRGELRHVVEDLERAVREAGVRIRLSTVLDRALVEAHRPDALVLATGARPVPPPWDPGRLTVPVDDVLAGARLPDGPVLVVDELGFHHATSVAELLAARGHDTEIVTPALVVGQDLGLTLDREGFRRRAHAAGVRCSTDRAVLGVSAADAAGESGVVVELLHHPTGRTERREVAAVIAAVSDASPSPDFRGRAGSGPGEDGPVVHRIGDALTPRRADAAIREGATLELS
ncbi:FAD-dependent oxidoreductase [Pseudonocardia sp. NPDC049635]|uniref:FAD-dependent oxidoreductase n=1 Tax=Pseudonocardia sp. NPDC049635 TaxID=3155506 RepID=UPI0033DE45C0